MMGNNIQNMIAEGNFGNTMPNNNYGYMNISQQQILYNPYDNNVTMYQQYNNWHYQPQQQIMHTNVVPVGQTNYNNDYTFRPVQQPYYNNGYVTGGGLGCNQQQYYNNQYYNNPYYNRYATMMNNNPYYYDEFAVGFNPDGSLRRLSYREVQQQQIDSFKIMIKCCDGFFGRTHTEEELEQIANPKFIDKRTEEEIQNDREFAEMKRLSMLEHMPQPESRMQRKARLIGDMSYNMHQAFDHMSLCEFLHDHFWKLREEQWLRENVDFNAGRNLKKTYSSDTYNELLGMHSNSVKSANPYTSNIMNNSRYESDMDDLEMGLPNIMEAQRRKKALLEGKVPTFISSEETQERRHNFINQVINNMYKKHGGGPA